MLRIQVGLGALLALGCGGAPGAGDESQGAGLLQLAGAHGAVQSVPLYRYWNDTAVSDHLYTTSWGEKGWSAGGWDYEGIEGCVFETQAPGTVPLYRYWNPGGGDHFYTTNWDEMGSGANGWSYERIQAYVYPTQVPGSVPLYRYWSPLYGGDHFYTTNWNELGAGAHGWGFELVQCYVYPLRVPALAPGSPDYRRGPPQGPPGDPGEAPCRPVAPWLQPPDPSEEAPREWPGRPPEAQ